MLAALQHDPFPAGSLDPTASAFNSDYGSLSYMDTSAPQDDSLPSVHQSGLSFPDYSGSGNSFDVTNFTQDLGMNASVTPASEPDHEAEPVKAEQQPGV